MARVVVHIGTGKTGTTSIQWTLARASKRGALPGVKYPLPAGGPPTDHALLSALYKPRRALARALRARTKDLSEADFQSQLDAYRGEIFGEIRTSERVVLSTEYLSGIPPDGIARFHDDLTAAGAEKVTVLAYVRDPVTYYPSYLQQRLRGAGEFIPPDRFKYDFAEMLEAWSSVFDDVVVRPFDPGRMVGGGVVQDFLACAYQALDLAPVPELETVTTTNESISAEGMVLLQRYWAARGTEDTAFAAPEVPRLLQLMREAADVFPQTKPRLVPSAAEDVYRRHAADLAFLRAKFDVSLGERPAVADGTGETHGRQSGEYRDVSDVVIYDEDTLDRLAMYCLRSALMVPAP